MSPTDPRHGSPAGYTRGCREACCRRAKKVDRMERERLAAGGHEFQVPRDRIIRKIRALHALGWTSVDVGRAMGCSGQAVNQVLVRPNATMRASVAERYDQVYREMEMRIPPDDMWHRRSRNKALAQGDKPPLAWEDIDAGILADEGPRVLKTRRLDHDQVDYVMQTHDFEVWLSPLEKVEVVRRWTADGRSEASLCRLTGWKEGRYSRANKEAS